jgi:hypothetical protein
MSIPVNALKDDELLHYAALDPGAASELARRIAETASTRAPSAKTFRFSFFRLHARPNTNTPLQRIKSPTQLRL